MKTETKHRMSTVRFSKDRNCLCPFNYNPMAAGCIVTVVLIKAGLDPTLIVINDVGRTQLRLWQAWSAQQMAKPEGIRSP